MPDEYVTGISHLGDLNFPSLPFKASVFHNGLKTEIFSELSGPVMRWCTASAWQTRANVLPVPVETRAIRMGSFSLLELY